MSGVREGYPVIADPSHPLWEAQEAGWPDHLPHEAWTEVVAAAKPGRGNSAQHPVFAVGYIKNPLASPPEQDGADSGAERTSSKERR
jgi:hypothetical protein